jgi:hypothetical protein
MAQLCKGEETRADIREKHNTKTSAPTKLTIATEEEVIKLSSARNAHRAEKQRPTKRNVFFPIPDAEKTRSLTMVSIAFPTYCNINR